MERYTLPLKGGKLIPIETATRDQLSVLDVVWADKFNAENIRVEDAMEKEAEFYRGAPPQWLNFYWAERENFPFVRRDLYNNIARKINDCKQKSVSIANIKLLHSPGSGGSTLAMQVLWDLRKKLRCAKVMESTTDVMAVARQVVELFNVGGSKKQNTVLLLLDNMETPEEYSEFGKKLEGSLIKVLKEKSDAVSTSIPVVIILNCLRQTCITERKAMILHRQLSENEKHSFQEKQTEITKRYEKRHYQFHGFNIMESDFSSQVVSKICQILKPIKTKRRSRQDQLLAVLSLLNSYVPGSYLTHDVCKMFFEKNRPSAFFKFSLVERMHHISDILVEFSAQEGEKRVQMAHPMIADECLQLLTSEGVTRSNTIRNLLIELTGTLPGYLVKALRKMLTKRQMDGDKLNKFSNMIQDISKTEGKKMCISVLKQAAKKFNKDPFLAQVLSRFYYIENSDFQNAEQWAKVAISREKENSFIRDTLGQVYKNQLKKKAPQSAKEILHIGKLAIEAFESEAIIAKNEQGPNALNYRGFFGYIQSAKTIFFKITNADNRWSEVLTKENNPQTLFSLNERRIWQKYKTLLTSLRDQVESKFTFLEWYLTYSKPSIYKDEPAYVWPDIDECYNIYVTQIQQEKTVLQKLKEAKVSTFAGLYRACCNPERDFNLITDQWSKMYSYSPNDVDAVQNYILANIILSQENATSAVRPLKELQSMIISFWNEQKEYRSPEFYLLILLLFWPDGSQLEDNKINITECVTHMHKAFNSEYKNDLRSRYLVPLFLLREGEGLQRFIPTLQLNKDVIDHLTKGGEREEISDLLRVEGEMKNYDVLIGRGQTQIRVTPNCRARVRGNGLVSFYLGFSIKGPIAYNIHKITGH